MEKGKRNGRTQGTLLILTAGVFWGSMGLFVRKLSGWGFDAIQIACLRLTVAAVVFALLHAALEFQSLWIRARDIPLFLGLGLGSILFFTVCYFTAIGMMSLSTAAILLYTSPIWVTLLSCIFFRERMTAKKLAALACAFGGCVLVSGLGGGGLSVPGLLVGLGSGFGYGLYSILGTVALKKYSPLTVTAYTFLVAALGAWLICAPADMLGKISAADSRSGLLLFIVLTGLVTAVIPFGAYTRGLEQLEASRAAILATVEPMVATLLGALVFRETLTLCALLGVVLILLSVVLLNLREKKSASTQR